MRVSAGLFQLAGNLVQLFLLVAQVGCQFFLKGLLSFQLLNDILFLNAQPLIFLALRADFLQRIHVFLAKSLVTPPRLLQPSFRFGLRIGLSLIFILFYFNLVAGQGFLPENVVDLPFGRFPPRVQVLDFRAGMADAALQRFNFLIVEREGLLQIADFIVGLV